MGRGAQCCIGYPSNAVLTHTHTQGRPGGAIKGRIRLRHLSTDWWNSMSTWRRRSVLPLLWHIRMKDRMAFQHSEWTILLLYDAVKGPRSQHK